MTGDLAPSLWEGESSRDAVFKEGAEWRKQYFDDVQFVFSRVQHHHHRWDGKKKKKWFPLFSCWGPQAKASLVLGPRLRGLRA